MTVRPIKVGIVRPTRSLIRPAIGPVIISTTDMARTRPASNHAERASDHRIAAVPAKDRAKRNRRSDDGEQCHRATAKIPRVPLRHVALGGCLAVGLGDWWDRSGENHQEHAEQQDAPEDLLGADLVRAKATGGRSTRPLTAAASNVPITWPRLSAGVEEMAQLSPPAHSRAPNPPRKTAGLEHGQTPGEAEQDAGDPDADEAQDDGFAWVETVRPNHPTGRAGTNRCVVAATRMPVAAPSAPTRRDTDGTRGVSTVGEEGLQQNTVADGREQQSLWVSYHQAIARWKSGCRGVVRSTHRRRRVGDCLRRPQSQSEPVSLAASGLMTVCTFIWQHLRVFTEDTAGRSITNLLWAMEQIAYRFGASR